MSTTRLPSHSAQVKETRRSLYDSESGVKKMAVGHRLGEHSHMIERSHNLLSGERVERQDFVNLEEGRTEWVWEQKVGWVFGSGDCAHLHECNILGAVFELMLSSMPVCPFYD